METPGECDSELSSPHVPAIEEASEGQEMVPSSPPPSYEHVLEEVGDKFTVDKNNNKNFDTLNFILPLKTGI